MRKLLLITLIALSTTGHAALSDKTYGNASVEKITSIYDADTFRANIWGWPEVIGHRMAIRINGIDAPEIRGKCAKEKEAAQKAKQFTVQALRSGKTIELRNIQRGKYFRLIADVYIDNKSLADQLIQAGHARPYNGGTRLSWCKHD